MLRRMSPTSPRSSRSRRRAARDAGLRKISFVTRVFVVGSVAAAGAFTALAGVGPTRPVEHDGQRVGRRRSRRPAVRADDGRDARVVGGPDVDLARDLRLPATSTSPATVAPSTDGNSGGSALAPPTTLPAPVYQYAPPVVISGAS